MTSNSFSNRVAYALSVVLTLTTIAAFGATLTTDESTVRPAVADAEKPVVISQVGAPPATPSVGDTPRVSWQSPYAGVREAATQGRTALRRYIFRTRMIYGYSFRDFEKLLPEE